MDNKDTDLDKAATFVGGSTQEIMDSFAVAARIQIEETEGLN